MHKAIHNDERGQKQPEPEGEKSTQALMKVIVPGNRIEDIRRINF
jgi:hypothetical protein